MIWCRVIVVCSNTVPLMTIHTLRLLDYWTQIHIHTHTHRAISLGRHKAENHSMSFIPLLSYTFCNNKTLLLLVINIVLNAQRNDDKENERLAQRESVYCLLNKTNQRKMLSKPIVLGFYVHRLPTATYTHTLN